MSGLPRSSLVVGSLLAAVGGLSSSPAHAIGSTFTFKLNNGTATPSTPLASASKSFTASAGGSSLNLVFQNALRPNGNAKPVSATAEGLCIYKVGGASSNCGRASAGDGVGNSNQDSIALFFDKEVELVSYQYGGLQVGLANPLITWGEPFPSSIVSTEGLSEGLSPKKLNTTYAFDNPFIVKANQIIYITGTGGDSGGTTTQALLSQLVVRTDPTGQGPTEPVPAPLPLLGAGAAFAWSRRLRSRLNSLNSH